MKLEAALKLARKLINDPSFYVSANATIAAQKLVRSLCDESDVKEFSKVVSKEMKLS